jgi:excinuclease ABC subunit C
VYLFKDSTGRILYVGKAKSLKNRVSSYFQPPVRLGLKTARLVENIRSIDYIEVRSETEALLLESRLIKKFQPQYNIISKDDKSPYYIHITLEEFPRPVINHNSDRAIAGPFLNSQIPKRILRQFRRISPFCIANRSVKRVCFYSHLGLCDPCPGRPFSPIEKKSYLANISRLRRLLHGQFSSVRIQLTRDMKASSNTLNFESAARLRDQLAALDQLLSSPVPPEEYLINPNLTQDLRDQAVSALEQALSLSPLHRIEMYDMAHLSGTSSTGAMTVAIDGELNSGNYRHFSIKFAPGNSDVDMMREVLSRRLSHPDWPVPDLIVLDGGKSQLSIIRDIPFPCPVIALSKKEEILTLPSVDGYREIKLNRTDSGLQLLQRLRDEAHRFSRRLHHRQRAKIN